MTNTIPDSIRDDAFNLDGGAQSILYKITLANAVVLNLSPKGDFTWQGTLYEEVPCHMSGVDRKADSESSRPKFSVVNPGRMFTAAVHERHLEGAILTRYRMMTEDLLADNAASVSDTYRISRVMNVTKDLIVVECRRGLDGTNFKLPNRSFRPPEFPVVRVR